MTVALVVTAVALTCAVAWLIFGRCRHAHHRREWSTKGVLMLVCDVCGRRVEALTLTAKQRRAMRKKFPPIPPARAVRAPAADEKVTPMRRAK